MDLEWDLRNLGLPIVFQEAHLMLRQTLKYQRSRIKLCKNTEPPMRRRYPTYWKQPQRHFIDTENGEETLQKYRSSVFAQLDQ